MKLGYILLTLPLLAVNITANASSVYSQGDCYISDPASFTQEAFRTKCTLDFYTQLGETAVIATVGRESYELYNYDQRNSYSDGSLRKNGKHIIKLNDEPAYTFYRNFKNLTITDEDNEDAMYCFKSEYTEVCYKEEEAYIEAYPID